MDITSQPQLLHHADEAARAPNVIKTEVPQTKLMKIEKSWKDDTA